MPVSFLMKLFEVNKIPGMGWLDAVPALKPEQVRQSHDQPHLMPQIVYIGLRDVDSGERGAILAFCWNIEFSSALLKKLGIKAFTMQHVDRYGIGKVHLNTMASPH